MLSFDSIFSHLQFIQMLFYSMFVINLVLLYCQTSLIASVRLHCPLSCLRAAAAPCVLPQCSCTALCAASVRLHCPVCCSVQLHCPLCCLSAAALPSLLPQCGCTALCRLSAVALSCWCRCTDDDAGSEGVLPLRRHGSAH